MAKQVGCYLLLLEFVSSNTESVGIDNGYSFVVIQNRFYKQRSGLRVLKLRTAAAWGSAKGDYGRRKAIMKLNFQLSK